MILVVILAILAVTLLFMGFISEYTMVLGRHFLILPIVFGIMSLIGAFLSFRLDTTNKTESVIYKNPADAKVEIVSTHNKELFDLIQIGTVDTTIKAGDTITQNKLDYLKENTDSAKVIISKGKESSTRDDVSLDFEDLNKPKPGMKVKLEKVTYSTADVTEHVMGLTGVHFKSKVVTVYVRYVNNKDQKELNDIYGDNN
jgi:hypothetical protein